MSKAHRDYFNGLASQWDDKMPNDPILFDYLIRFNIQPGSRVLDIGAGTGRMTRHLMKRVGKKGCIVAEDIADRMLWKGMRQLDYPCIFWVCDDVMRLSFRDQVFDKVLCFSAFPHFTDPLEALKEMNRVLICGGRLLILHTCSSEQLNALHASLEGPVNKDKLPGIQEMRTLLRESGYKTVQMIENEDLYWVEAEKIS